MNWEVTVKLHIDEAEISFSTYVFSVKNKQTKTKYKFSNVMHWATLKKVATLKYHVNCKYTV